MSVFMLHFACLPPATDSVPLTAEVCVINQSLDDAEAIAREEIENRGQRPGELIAFAELDEEKVASLRQHETTLYLKALQQRSRCAVHFSPVR